MAALVDNLPLALPCAKGRARSRCLRSCLNQLCSLSLVTGSKLSARWIASEKKPVRLPQPRQARVVQWAP
eukprot:3696975-Pyramimonas_sp.AAC.1